MKTVILAAFAVLTLSVGIANSGGAEPYHAPAYNFQQNNWMSGR
jgi:hypothetical protein